MAQHAYAGEYRSAINRAKKILIAAGFTWSISTGRYPNNRSTKGPRVTRVGFSETVSLHLYGYPTSFSAASDAQYRSDMNRALEALRAGGLPFDERGWLACGRDAARAQPWHRSSDGTEVPGAPRKDCGCQSCRAKFGAPEICTRAGCGDARADHDEGGICPKLYQANGDQSETFMAGGAA